MARKTLGAFIDKSRVSSPQDFFRETWSSLLSGPDLLRPTYVGNVERLKRVESVDLNRVLSSEFIFANGRKVRGWVNTPAFIEHRYYSVTIHLDLAQREIEVAEQVYQWLRDSFPFSVVYMGSPTPDLFNSNRELHQMLNSGLVEISLHRAFAHRHLLDHFEQAV